VYSVDALWGASIHDPPVESIHWKTFPRLTPDLFGNGKQFVNIPKNPGKGLPEFLEAKNRPRATVQANC